MNKKTVVILTSDKFDDENADAKNQYVIKAIEDMPSIELKTTDLSAWDIRHIIKDIPIENRIILLLGIRYEIRYGGVAEVRIIDDFGLKIYREMEERLRAREVSVILFSIYSLQYFDEITNKIRLVMDRSDLIKGYIETPVLRKALQRELLRVTSL